MINEESDKGRGQSCPYTEITHEPHGDCPGFAGRSSTPQETCPHGYDYWQNACLICTTDPEDAPEVMAPALPADASYQTLPKD